MMPNFFRRAIVVAAMLSSPFCTDEAAARYNRHHPVPPANAVPKRDAALGQRSSVASLEAQSRFCQNHPCPPAIEPPDLFAAMESSLSEAGKAAPADREFAQFLREMNRASETAFAAPTP